MDLRKFVSCLSNSELEELQELVYYEKNARFDYSKFPPLNEEEKILLTSFGKVRTILAYKLRTNQNLYTCKMMVDLANNCVSV